MPQIPTDYLTQSPVARLATVDAAGQPLVVPICYVYDGRFLYSIVDRKPKRTSAGSLKRLRNIRHNPRVSFLVDTYDRDWSKLRYLIIQGEASILTAGPEQARAIGLLRAKYPQYLEMNLSRRPVIKITPKRVIRWAMQPQAG